MPTLAPCPAHPASLLLLAAAAIKLQEARRISRSRPPPIAYIRFPCRVATACCCSLGPFRFLCLIPLASALHSLLLLVQLIDRSRVIELQEFPTTHDGMKLEAVAASKSVSRSSSSAVAFSWEHEPGVSKQRHSDAKKTAAAAPRAEAVSRRMPASAKKQQAQVPAPAAVTVTAHPHRHRLRVPPPPGGPGAPAASPPGRRNPRSRRVRPADDPFLAAYLACTEDGGRGYKGAQKLLGWAGLGLGLDLGPRGLRLSCKSSCGAVEECVVRLAKIPGLDKD